MRVRPLVDRIGGFAGVPQRRAAILLAMGMSAILVAAAPFCMPASYSWVEHTTSEAGARGVNQAWIAGTGFVLWGSGVLALAVCRPRNWNIIATLFLGAFGLLMIGAGAFSTRSWVPGAAYGEREDLLHSICATGMGFAFAFGLVAVVVGRGRHGEPLRWLDVVAIGSAGAIPAASGALPDAAGLLQRIMFVVAYAWYGREAVLFLHSPVGRRETGDEAG